MSYGTSSINVKETSGLGCSRLRQRRNGLANIFSVIVPTALKTNGWGEWSEQTTRSNDDSDNSQIEDDECQTNQNEDTQSLNINYISSTPRQNEFHKLCKEIFVRQLSLSSCAQRKHQYSRTFSIDKLYSFLDSCHNRRRRNACPQVLDSITDWELKNLNHMFVSTVCEGSKQLVCF